MGYETEKTSIQNKGIRITATKGDEVHEGTITEVFAEITNNCLPFVEGKDYKVGEMFFYEGSLVEVCLMDTDGFEHGQGCDRCVFNTSLCEHDLETFKEKALCIPRYRRDKKSVFFRKVSNNVIKR